MAVEKPKRGRTTPAYPHGLGARGGAFWTEASWISGEPPDRRDVNVRGILVWRRDGDGRWRVALEHIS